MTFRIESGNPKQLICRVVHTKTFAGNSKYGENYGREKD